MKEWTDDQESELWSLHKRGLAAKVISRRIGRTPRAVYNKIYQMKEKRKFKLAKVFATPGMSSRQKIILAQKKGAEIDEIIEVSQLSEGYIMRVLKGGQKNGSTY